METGEPTHTRYSLQPHLSEEPANAQPDFYAIWADGDTLKPSESNLFFTDKNGSTVWRLPAKMTAEFARPEKVQ